MRIGIVDLDTSHPAAWLPLERELGHEVVGVWDGGAVHPAGYAEAFAAQHGIPRVFGSLAEMAPDVDCAIVHGCDWDTHIAKARPFIEAGKSVLVDKPLGGNLADLEQLRAWARSGVRITGGSSLRFCTETEAWLARPAAERGTPRTVFCGCGVDEFNYGIHAYAMLSGIMGPGARTVQCLADGAQRLVRIDWQDGRAALLAVGGGPWLPFHATIVSEKTVHQYQAGADANQLYRSLLRATLPYLAGEVGEPPAPIDALLEPELCALAACQSKLAGGAPVELDRIDAALASYDGRSFAAAYRRGRYPGAS
jgi:hypothetical protein